METVTCPRCGETIALEPGATMAYHKCSRSAVAANQKMPSMPRRAWNFSKALASFVADGCKTVEKEEYRRRLTICSGCDRRSGGGCKKCGCNLALKAKGRAWKCPLGKWDPPAAIAVSLTGIVGLADGVYWCEHTPCDSWEFCDDDLPEWVAVWPITEGTIAVSVCIGERLSLAFRGPAPANFNELDDLQIPRVEGQSGECRLSAIKT